MSVIRDGIKRFVERSLVFTGRDKQSRRRHRQDVLFLAYHNIVPNGSLIAGDRSLHLPQSAFARQLDTLQRTHEVVGILEGIDSARSAVVLDRERPQAVVTFDDAYRGAITAGVAELRARGLPATVFVTPEFVGTKPFWWDMLADPDDGLPSHVRQIALTTARGRNEEVIAWAQSTGIAIHDVLTHSRCSSLDEIAEAVQYPKLTLGSHTQSHPNLTRLTPDELKVELSSSREWLRQHFGDRALPIISYPYGQANATVWAAAKAVGYVAGFMIEGGWTSAGHPNRLALPRLNIPAGVSDDGFTIRAAGLVAN